MTLKFELAKSNRSMCIKCNKLIKRGLPRIQNGSGKFICDCCGENYINKEINYLRKRLKDWGSMIKQNSKEIVMNRLK